MTLLVRDNRNQGNDPSHNNRHCIVSSLNH